MVILSAILSILIILYQQKDGIPYAFFVALTLEVIYILIVYKIIDSKGKKVQKKANQIIKGYKEREEAFANQKEKAESKKDQFIHDLKLKREEQKKTILMLQTKNSDLNRKVDEILRQIDSKNKEIKDLREKLDDQQTMRLHK